MKKKTTAISQPSAGDDIYEIINHAISNEEAPGEIISLPPEKGASNLNIETRSTTSRASLNGCMVDLADSQNSQLNHNTRPDCGAPGAMNSDSSYHADFRGSGAVAAGQERLNQATSARDLANSDAFHVQGRFTTPNNSTSINATEQPEVFIPNGPNSAIAPYIHDQFNARGGAAQPTAPQFPHCLVPSQSQADSVISRTCNDILSHFNTALSVKSNSLPATTVSARSTCASYKKTFEVARII